MTTLWASRAGRVSVQVLNEYYVTVTRKLSPKLPYEEAHVDVRDSWCCRLYLNYDDYETCWDAICLDGD